MCSVDYFMFELQNIHYLRSMHTLNNRNIKNSASKTHKHSIVQCTNIVLFTVKIHIFRKAIYTHAKWHVECPFFYFKYVYMCWALNLNSIFYSILYRYSLVMCSATHTQTCTLYTASKRLSSNDRSTQNHAVRYFKRKYTFKMKI